LTSIDSKVAATIALEADERLVKRLLEEVKTSGELMIRTKIKFVIDIKNTMKKQRL
jgi:hypothetical protein